jgi:L-asparagine transporter-like permease
VGCSEYFLTASLRLCAQFYSKLFWKRGNIQVMNFPDFSQIPQWIKALLSVIVWATIIYHYFKNRKKKVQVDPDYIEYSTAIGIGSFALVLILSVVIVFVYGADKDGISRAMNNMIWIIMILAVRGISFIEYKFRRKKK